MRVVGIGNGSVEQLRNFKEQFNPVIEVYTDPSLACFRKFGMKKKFGIGPRAIMRYLKTLSSGYRQGWTQGDPWQQGGVVIVDANMNVTWRHVDDGPGDHADIDALKEQIKIECSI